MVYLKPIIYFSKAVYQVICLTLQYTIFIKILFQDQQGYSTCLQEIRSGTFNVTEHLRETLWYLGIPLSKRESKYLEQRL